MGSGRVYTMFAAPVRFVEPLMFHLATQHNAAAKAVAGAEKTSFAWVKGAPPFRAPAATALALPHASILSRHPPSTIPSLQHLRRALSAGTHTVQTVFASCG
jgi:hypothetical protein